jgi:hypothetical protein
MVTETPAHDQVFVHKYVVHYPAHAPRKDDPHYKDFEAYRKRTKPTAKCTIGEHRSDFSGCQGELELHHTHIEFAVQNEIDLKWLEVDYPGVSDPSDVGAWVESASNLTWLCEFHHRGAGGVHSATASDFEGEKYVRGLISSAGTN